MHGGGEFVKGDVGRGFFERKRGGEFGAAFGTVAGGDLAAVSQDNSLTDGQAQADAAADIDEHDIPRAHRFLGTGVAAFASARGDPSRRIPLSFVRVEPYVVPKKSLTGDNTERVDTRVLQVVYRVDQDEAGLFVGMQVDVFLQEGMRDEG